MITQNQLLISFLKSVPLLAALKEGMLTEIASRVEKVYIKGGEWVFHEGELGSNMYVIRSGLVQVVAENTTPPTILRVLGRSEFFGELALLEQATHSASIRALRDTELIKIHQKDFIRLIKDHPRVVLDLSRYLCKRLCNQSLSREAGIGSSKRAQYLGVLTLLSLHGEVPFNFICSSIHQTLAKRLDVGFLDGDSACTAHENGTMKQDFGRLLDRYERSHELVVLVAGKATSSPEWVSFCIRQADRIVMFSHVETPPARVPIDDSLERHDLALFGAERTDAQVAAWLDATKPLSHFHLREGETFQDDIARMCRRLVSASVGVVFCGGGARALAHVGAVIGLQEAGLEIDRIGGVSMGAFLGALFAMGCSTEDVRSICMQELGPNPFDDYTIPFISLIKAQKASRMLKRVFGKRTIEGLLIDFFCVSADLVSAQAVVHRRGNLVTAVGASISIPGIAPPVAHEGKLLVDGGVLNNLPTDIMRDQGEGPVVACDLITGGNMKDTSIQPPVPIPGFSRLFRRGSAKLPNILQTLTRTSVLSSVRNGREQQAMADLVVCPHMEHIGFFDWKKVDEAIETGRDEIIRVLNIARQDGRLQRILNSRPNLVLADRGEIC